MGAGSGARQASFRFNCVPAPARRAAGANSRLAKANSSPKQRLSGRIASGFTLNVTHHPAQVRA